LGLLVRPDLGVFSAGFLVTLLAAPGVRGWRRRAGLLAWALALPVAYQFFRMGYFAAMEPSTALAKEAGESFWPRGWIYLRDFVDPYILFVPVLAAGALATLELRAARPARKQLLLVWGPTLVAAGIHALFIVRVGGDFMHARLLLPSLFAALLPVSVVPLRREPLHAALVATVAVWATLGTLALRPPSAGPANSAQVRDERAYYVRFSGRARPITLEDYRRLPWADSGRALGRLSRSGRRAFVAVAPLFGSLLRPEGVPNARARAPVVTSAGTIGLMGYAAGPRVHIVDLRGLADSIAARNRLERVRLPGGRVAPKRARAGHDKLLPVEWVAGRFGPQRVVGRRSRKLLNAWTAAARRALACPPAERLLIAVSTPLTPGRFLSNVAAAPALDRLRFSPDPTRAAAELCTERAL
jgi:arabinofuranosyltransferase